MAPTNDGPPPAVRIRVRPGQVWQIQRGDHPDDPLLVRVIEAWDDGWCRTQTYLHSDPTKILATQFDRKKDIEEAATLVEGPGSQWVNWKPPLGGSSTA